MLFNSIQFAIFFPIVAALYFLLPQRHRWAMLLGASCVFYMAFIPVYIWILALTIVVDYSAALVVSRTSGAPRRLALITSIVVTCLILFCFKYFNFVTENVTALSGMLGWNYGTPVLRLVLPIGLSFHTFQSVSYVIEVYRGNQKPERHFGIYALYVMFFPQLVAGPIERPQNLLHQFREKHDFDYTRITNGLKLMTWGLFKKVVIADRLASLVSTVYSDARSYPGLPAIIATALFAFQIFCDFSGYSDIAIGSAQVLGFRLTDNFNRPYYASSMGEFWHRWHISLSTWFRDYLYIPLGGSRCGRLRTSFNLFVTFLVSGLWHGANWTFVTWGAYHGLLVAASQWTNGIRTRARRVLGFHAAPFLSRSLRITFTFSLVCIGWIFFRAASISDALFILRHLLPSLPADLAAVATDATARRRLLYLDHQPITLVLSLLGIFGLEAVHYFQRHSQMRALVAVQPAWIRWTFYYAIALAIMFAGVFARTQFIYFQF